MRTDYRGLGLIQLKNSWGEIWLGAKFEFQCTSDRDELLAKDGRLVMRHLEWRNWEKKY